MWATFSPMVVTLRISSGTHRRGADQAALIVNPTRDFLDAGGHAHGFAFEVRHLARDGCRGSSEFLGLLHGIARERGRGLGEIALRLVLPVPGLAPREQALDRGERDL